MKLVAMACCLIAAFISSYELVAPSPVQRMDPHLLLWAGYGLGPSEFYEIQCGKVCAVFYGIHPKLEVRDGRIVNIPDVKIHSYEFRIPKTIEEEIARVLKSQDFRKLNDAYQAGGMSHPRSVLVEGNGKRVWCRVEIPPPIQKLLDLIESDSFQCALKKGKSKNTQASLDDYQRGSTFQHSFYIDK